MANLAFIDLNYEKIFDTIKVVTFGSPRVGNKRWVNHFNALTNSESRRYLIKGDPITILPECLSIFCGYRHAGIKIVCKKKQQICTQVKEVDDGNIFGKIAETYDDMVMDEEMKTLIKDQDVGGLIDHIYGYPKIHDFSLIINGKTVTE